MSASVFQRAAIAENALQEASKIKTAVTDAVKDKLRVATQQIRRSRYAASDRFEEAKHAIKQKPIAAVTMAFAAGLLLGGILACTALPRRP